MADDPMQLLQDVLDAVQSGFSANAEKVTTLTSKVSDLEKSVEESKGIAREARGGVIILDEGLRALQETLAEQIAPAMRTLSDGMIQLSAQVSNLRNGVASQVRHEVEKSFDVSRSIEELAERPPIER